VKQRVFQYCLSMTLPITLISVRQYHPSEAFFLEVGLPWLWPVCSLWGEGVLMYSTGRNLILISFPVILSSYRRIPIRHEGGIK
jgi:hypothetical protein